MKKEDLKVLIHVGLALIVILGGFILIEIFSKPTITARTISLIGKDVNCVNVVNMEYQSIGDKDNCCRLIQQTDNCELLDGIMRLEYTEGSKTTEPKSFYNANYVCYAGADAKLYFSFGTYEYCELSGYRIFLK